MNQIVSLFCNKKKKQLPLKMLPHHEVIKDQIKSSITLNIEGQEKYTESLLKLEKA